MSQLLLRSDDVILLDGFPRTLNQGLALHSSKDLNVERVLLLQVPDDVCMKRMISRKDPLREGRDTDTVFCQNRLKYYNDSLQDIYSLFRGKV